MNADIAGRTVGELVAERPSRSRIFEKWGIDYCCKGKQRLADSCAVRSLDIQAVRRDLLEEAVEESGEETDWTAVPLPVLVSHIVTTHHAFLREALPRLSALTAKVRDAHAQRHPELVEVASVFAAFRTEMEAHTCKEEALLFPAIEQLDQVRTPGVGRDTSVRRLIARMEQEHDAAGAALETLRRLTDGFAVPAGACATYRAMLDALAALAADTHRHVHKENCILFPRAETREAELSASAVLTGG